MEDRGRCINRSPADEQDMKEKVESMMIFKGGFGQLGGTIYLFGEKQKRSQSLGGNCHKILF